MTIQPPIQTPQEYQQALTVGPEAQRLPQGVNDQFNQREDKTHRNTPAIPTQPNRTQHPALHGRYHRLHRR